MEISSSILLLIVCNYAWISMSACLLGVLSASLEYLYEIESFLTLLGLK